MKISAFISQKFHFLEVKFSVYLNRRVFVILKVFLLLGVGGINVEYRYGTF